MKAAVAIRPMTAGDIPSAMALADTLPEAPHWNRSVYETALHPAIQPGRMVLLAEAPDGSLAGFAVASWTGPEAELESIAVAPAWQRRRVAHALFSHLAAHLRDRGAQSVLLEVRVSNRPARNLYHSLGFAETGRRRGYYADPREDAIILRLELVSGPPDAVSEA
ncbi:MAG TPA: ribosomal protein S18-alanine N-acetyltransferase [Terracidiphilus sp.]|nr:ribosomal protein S18-alanine N-acetyltransferase [Terracidiphilus sp.]